MNAHSSSRTARRRSGKSRIAAAIGIYLALFVKHRLSAGERGIALFR